MLRIDILTTFPGMFHGPLSESMMKRAVEKGAAALHIHDLREFSHDRHRTTDDSPYGGGAGMVMKAAPILEALDLVLGDRRRAGQRVILLSPQGVPFTQGRARELAGMRRLVLICGHYRGVDARVQEVVDEELSIGDYVLTGGELPAMVVVDAVVRLLPGVIGCRDSCERDTFQARVLDAPQYTRPEVERGMRVPGVLLSGNHRAIEQWRLEQSLRATMRKRPDLLRTAGLTPQERRVLGRVRRMDSPRRKGVENSKERT